MYLELKAGRLICCGEKLRVYWLFNAYFLPRRLRNPTKLSHCCQISKYILYEFIYCMYKSYELKTGFLCQKNRYSRIIQALKHTYV